MEEITRLREKIQKFKVDMEQIMYCPGAKKCLVTDCPHIYPHPWENSCDNSCFGTSHCKPLMGTPKEMEDGH